MYVFACVGVVMILIGAADVLSRISKSLDSSILRTAFSPAIVLLNATSTDAFFGATVATSTPMAPTQLSIPSIGVKANVEKVGKKSDGSMATPAKFDDVAWYGLGSKPGEPGNAVIAGHVNNALTTSGVFEHLGSVKLGDSVSVSDAGDHILTYQVTDIEEYAENSAPIAAIFATTGPSRLVLITCDGEWLSKDKTFSKRLVVFASLK